jgi:hypothetical protein
MFLADQLLSTGDIFFFTGECPADYDIRGQLAEEKFLVND